MAHTDHQTMRRVLRREIAGTIGLLTDEHDFRAMRRYRTFTFDDHATYLQQVEDLLRTRASQGSHTTVALFDPQEYAEFCADTGLDPDTPSSRTRFTAELATTGADPPVRGPAPRPTCVPALVDEAVRQATWEYATTLLARLGACAVLRRGHRPRRLRPRLRTSSSAILDTARPGNHHLVCSVTAPRKPSSPCSTPTRTPSGAAQLDEAEALEFTTVLALGIATQSPGGLVMRTSAPGTPDRIYGWRLRGDGLEPLTAGEVFDAYCTDVDSGDLISPESGRRLLRAPRPRTGPDSTSRPHH